MFLKEEKRHIKNNDNMNSGKKTTSSRIQYLAKNTLIITIGRISTQFISFLLLPLYTSILSTEEYGTVDLITTIVHLLVPIVSLMIDQGAFRFLLSCDNDSERTNIISSAFFILIGYCVIASVLYLIIMPLLLTQYKIWILLITVATAFSNLFLQFARGLQKTMDYSVGSFICSSIIILLNVLCIASLKMGAVGMLIAAVGGNIICCIFLFFKLRVIKYISLASVSKKTIIDELKYSIPLVPNQLSIWVMNSSDRMIVTLIIGVSANGILAVSHKFPTIIMSLFNIFLLAWHETGAVHFFDEDRDEFFSDTIDRVVMFFSTICMGIIALLPVAFRFLVNSSYGEAFFNIPIYILASIFNIIVGMLGVVYVATKKTFEIAKTTILAAIINIIFNLALIEKIGLYAASISTLAGYFITFLYRIIDTKKYFKIRINYLHCMIVSIGIITSFIICYLNNPIISVASLPIVIGIAFFVNKDSIHMIKGYLSKKRKYDNA